RIAVFFQAEDGIRDDLVTGVQTCALPIFSGLRAVQDVSFAVDDGELFAVIGPNGAGKTTLFNMIAGALAPDAGTIVFAGARLDRSEERRVGKECKAELAG